MNTKKSRPAKKTQNENKWENFAQFPEENPNPVLQISKKGIILYSNEASNMLTAKWRVHGEIIVPEKVLHLIKKTISERSKNVIELLCGEKTFLITTVSVPETDYSNVYGLDITKRKKTEDSLRKLTRAVNQSSASIVITDTKGVIEYVNPGFVNTTGYSPKEVIGKNPSVLKSGYTKQEEYGEMWKTILSGEEWKGEFHNRKKNGDLYWETATISPVKNERGEITHFIAVKEDITERKAAEALHKKDEEDIRRSEERYRSLFMQMAEGFALYEIMYDKNGDPSDYRFLEVNSAFEKLTGLKRANILYRLQSSILPGENPEFVKMYAEVAKTRKPMNFTQYSKILERYYDVIAFSPEKGKFATLTNDVTEQKQAEEAKNNFIAVMAHELRNPLMPIYANAELLESYFSDESKQKRRTDPQIKDSIDVIIQQTKTMSRLLDDLLNISRIIHGKITLKKSIIDLSLPIQTAVEATRSFINAQNHSFTISLPSSPVYINADPVRIEQVVTNLLTNAIKYTKPGGHISIETGLVGNMAEIKVKDTGIGIHPKDAKKIFGMFAQSAKPFVKTQGDFGIGLKVATDIVKMHGGTIEAKSDGIGRGSEFIVRFPTTEKALEKAQEKITHVAVEKHRILVVDDNKDITDSLQRILAHLGHTIEVAGDGKSAVAAVENFVPELVLLDIGLPDITGYEVARTLREKYGNALKLVALTGYGQQQDKITAKEAGFNFHLTKPVSIKDINKAIEECFK